MFASARLAIELGHRRERSSVMWFRFVNPFNRVAAAVETVVAVATAVAVTVFFVAVMVFPVAINA